jgi:hypothetical protein
MSNSIETGPGDTPSTAWRETVASDEAARFAEQARQMAEMQQRKSVRYGRGRALHRKQVLGARATLEVFKGLPEFARQGLFAKPGRHDALVRLSNGGMDKASDRKPDIRGFALAVQGVSGPSALGNGDASAQCFALINQSQFAFPKSTEFVDFVVAASHGNGALLAHLLRRHGLIGGPKRLLKLAKSLGKPFTGFATETFYSAAPIACGPFAVRVRLTPDASNGPAGTPSGDWGADMASRLKSGALAYQLELQPFVSEARTPIEDASVNWPTAYVPVARLNLPRQDAGADADLQARIEAGFFDPWVAMAAHRPLGDVMRSRKVVYFESQKGRGAMV